MRMSSLFNPLILLTLQTLAALLLVDSNYSSDLRYILFVAVPFIIYLIFYPIINLNRGKATESGQVNIFTPAQVRFSLFLIVLITLCNIWLISGILPFYGGLIPALSSMGSSEIATILQQKGPEDLRKLIFVNYFLTVTVVPLALSNLKFKNAIIFICLLICFFFSSLYGARTLFIEPLLALVIVKSTEVSMTPRRVSVFLLALVAAIFGMSYLQAIRFGKDSVLEGLDVLKNYYTISLNQGANIIANDVQREPFYWTLSSLFRIPVITSIFGFRSVYEGLIGPLPIQDRADDFSYVASLGADPRYNTLGIYAYMQLDAGILGILLLIFVFLFSGIIYREFYKGKQIGFLLFPAVFALILDQLRTFSIFSSRMPYFIIIAIIIYLVGQIGGHRRYEK